MLRVVVGVVSILLLVAAGSLVLAQHKLRDAQVQINNKQIELQQLQQAYARIQIKKQTLESPDKVEAAARQQLGMIYPGEVRVLP